VRSQAGGADGGQPVVPARCGRRDAVAELIGDRLRADHKGDIATTRNVLAPGAAPEAALPSPALFTRVMCGNLHAVRGAVDGTGGTCDA
jgi:hypothetical protein